LADSSGDGVVRVGVNRRWAWLSDAFASWIIAGVLLVARAILHGDTADAGLSPYHVVLYAGLIALTVLSVGLVVAARRRGVSWQQTWRHAYPAGLGPLGAGLIVLLATLVVDVGWREGVGIGQSIEGWIAPSRVLLLVGLSLLAMAPLRVALLAGSAPGIRWPVAISAGLLAGVLTAPGSLSPFVNPWLSRPPDVSADNGEIWVMDADGSRQTRLVPSAEDTLRINPAWSPDGQRIAYARYTGRPDDPTHADYDIWIVNADGSDDHAAITGPMWQWFPRWSPDGEWLAYTQESPGGPWLKSGPRGQDVGPGPQGPAFADQEVVGTPQADLWRIAVDGTGPARPITRADGDDRAGSWSPDGTRIAFDSTRDGNTEIYSADIDGGDAVRLTDDPAEDWAAAWSPDGSRIAFDSDRSGTAQIWVMGADGTNPKQLTDDPTGALWPAWSPDGRRIAFSGWQTGQQQAWSIASDGSDLRDLSQSPGSMDAIWDGSWAPRDRIVFSRAGVAPADLQPIVRQDLGVASMLVDAVVLALVAGLLALAGPPFGALGLMVGLVAALGAIQSDGWGFIPWAVATGLGADLALWLAPRHRPSVAAAAAGLALVAAVALGANASVGIGWSATLLLGTACAVAVGGWAIGVLLERHPFVRRDAVGGGSPIDDG
jgi:hypothetical protein